MLSSVMRSNDAGLKWSLLLTAIPSAVFAAKSSNSPYGVVKNGQLQPFSKAFHQRMDRENFIRDENVLLAPVRIHKDEKDILEKAMHLGTVTVPDKEDTEFLLVCVDHRDAYRLDMMVRQRDGDDDFDEYLRQHENFMLSSVFNIHNPEKLRFEEHQALVRILFGSSLRKINYFASNDAKREYKIAMEASQRVKRMFNYAEIDRKTWVKNRGYGMININTGCKLDINRSDRRQLQLPESYYTFLRSPPKAPEADSLDVFSASVRSDLQKVAVEDPESFVNHCRTIQEGNIYNGADTNFAKFKEDQPAGATQVATKSYTKGHELRKFLNQAKTAKSQVPKTQPKTYKADCSVQTNTGDCFV